MGIKLSNNAVSRLAGGISNTDTIVSVVPGEGERFPTLAAGDWFPATIINSAGEFEIVAVTERAGDVLTVTRAQENTSARGFDAGDRIEVRLTAGVFAELTADTQAILDSLSKLIPPGTGPIPYSLPTLPEGWVWADGGVLLPDTPYQALRTAYINASFPYGHDGNGNPLKPDMRGRVAAGRDNLGGTAAGRLSNATALGAALGAQTHTLTAAEMPVHSHSASSGTGGAHSHGGSTSSAGAHTHSERYDSSALNVTLAPSQWAGGEQGYIQGRPVTNVTVSETARSATTGSAGSHSHSITSDTHAGHTHSISVGNAGSGGAHNNVQPTLVTNYIIKT